MHVILSQGKGNERIRWGTYDGRALLARARVAQRLTRVKATVQGTPTDLKEKYSGEVIPSYPHRLLCTNGNASEERPRQ